MITSTPFIRNQTIAARSLRILRSLSVVTVATLCIAVWSDGAQAQTGTVCDASVRAEIAKIIDSKSSAPEREQLALQATLYEQYKHCAQGGALVPPSDPIHVAARQCGANISYLGNTFFEEMSCCGYDPQRRQFACPVKIKQLSDYGPFPLPGSREHTLHCVAVTPSGPWVPVGRDSVHLANAIPGSVPTWQFATITAANGNLPHLPAVYPMSGITRAARSILSWNLWPTSCNYQPRFGNVIEYRIRLDQ